MRFYSKICGVRIHVMTLCRKTHSRTLPCHTVCICIAHAEHQKRMITVLSETLALSVNSPPSSSSNQHSSVIVCQPSVTYELLRVGTDLCMEHGAFSAPFALRYRIYGFHHESHQVTNFDIRRRSGLPYTRRGASEAQICDARAARQKSPDAWPNER
jgi:hypothetical protein